MKSKSFAVLAAIFAVAALGFGYWYSTVYVPSQKTAKAPLVSAPEEQKPRYPIDDDESPPPVKAENKSPASAPVLFKSGETLEERLARFFDADRFNSLVSTKNLAHSFVVFIENISERRPSGTFSLFAPLSTEFQIASSDDDITLSPKNFGRYTQYIELLNSVEGEVLVRIYSHYYKNFQAAYDELGMGGYFNDRLVKAMDVVLAAPEPADNVILKGTGPYTFANPDFEKLPAGQKVMIRMGPENAKVLKEKIRQLRQLVSHRRNRARGASATK